VSLIIRMRVLIVWADIFEGFLCQALNSGLCVRLRIVNSLMFLMSMIDSLWKTRMVEGAGVVCTGCVTCGCHEAWCCSSQCT
jgi:hypothetical protein